MIGDKAYKKAKLLAFGDMIRMTRAQKKISSQALAKQAHLTQVTILKIERGIVDYINIKTLLKLEKILKFDAREYMDLTKK